MEVAQNSSKLALAFRKIPGPVSLPILGTTYLYKLGVYNVLKYHEVLQHLYKTYGPIVRERIGSSTLIHVFDPDDARTIYQNEGRLPAVVPLQETAQHYRQQADLSPGLGNVNGEEWYRLRAAVRHLMLRPKDVQHYLPAVHRVTQNLVTRLQANASRDMSGLVRDLDLEIAKWSQESAGVVCFDRRLGYLGDGEPQNVIEKVIQANKTVFKLSGLLKFSLPLYKYLPTPKWKKIAEAEDFMTRVATKYTEEALEKIEKLEKSNQLKDNQFSFLLSLLAKPNLTRRDVFIITFSLFYDGLSTTVPSVLHNLFCLASNPAVQEKAYEEISSIMGSSSEITPAHLSQLNYVKSIVKETFRMYPNGTEISRILPSDMVLSNYNVPSQTSVSINMGVHFRSAKHFTHPDEFRPGRWMRGDATDSVHPYVLTPFGIGTRTCVGRRFAEQDMYVLLTEVIRTFRLSLADQRPLELQYNTLLMPAAPLAIRFIPR